MNIQLNHAISDITGVTGMNIIQAILQGERDPKALANLSVGLCRKNVDTITKALEGNYRSEHLFALQQAHEAYQFFHKQIHKYEEIIEKVLTSLQVESPPPSSENDQSPASPAAKQGARKTKANRSPYHFDAVTALQRVTVANLTTIPGIDVNTAMKIRTRSRGGGGGGQNSTKINL